MNGLDERTKLLLFTDIVGAHFGTEDFCLFLHALIRMHRPRTIVELGTGLGITALWMALAAKRNQLGHVWTVDDFEFFGRRESPVEEIVAKLRHVDASLETSTAEEYYSGISRLFGLDPHLTFVKSKIALNEVGHFSGYPFSEKSIDLLFSDFKHGGIEILAILGHFLPRMASSSSIFIHSASTVWTSYLLLEQLTSQLNAGRIPKVLQDSCSVDLRDFVRCHRLVLVHLTECKEHSQNSAAWLKIEPVDLLPYPRTAMRGMNRQEISGKQKEDRTQSCVS